MREVVEVYRGVEIYRSHLQIGLANRPDGTLLERYEAFARDWLLVGSLDDVRGQIDGRIARGGSRTGIPPLTTQELQR